MTAYPDAPEELLPILEWANGDLEKLKRAIEFLDKWERVGPVEDNTWRLRQR